MLQSKSDLSTTFCGRILTQNLCKHPSFDCTLNGNMLSKYILDSCSLCRIGSWQFW
jgi:hypothetical protein